MMNNLWLTGVAIALDRFIGDPRWLPHPVVFMGKWIAFVEHILNKPEMSKRQRRVHGCLLTISTLLLSTVAPWVLLFEVRKYSLAAADVLNIILICTTIAWKGLVDAGREVLQALESHGVPAARVAVSKIVGRDTNHLEESEVIRATVETLAENIVDAIISPVVFACLGGAPLAFLYRAANTLDSMVGYRNQRYADFGWCSARVDDVLNFIPARITAVILLISFLVLCMNPVRAFQTMKRDARKHPSPNSGIPESLVAGALGVQLGGLNYYGGIPSHRATMGQPFRPLEAEDICRTIRVIHTTCGIVMGLVGIGGVLCLHL
jgi:adenosylcobinamide-phosphate synthase